jgi:polyhydroxyalkanoate synthesis repressor PhaR
MVQQRRASKSDETSDDVNAADRNLRVLKKYPNRRLYDTRNSSYITLADVKKMVLEGQEFVVRDAKTSDDLTRSILLQIILEEESGGVPMFSSQM